MRKVGLIAGQGDLPALILEALKSQSREVFTIAVKNHARSALVSDTPHAWLGMGEIAQSLPIFRAQGVTHIIMAGGVSRPPLHTLRPSLLALKMFCQLGMSFFRGDNALFKAITRILEKQGFQIIGADEILKDLLTPKACLTQATPHDLDSVTFAAKAARDLGAKDIGQAVIIQNDKILAAEDSTGTDALIKRVGIAQGAILAKMKKPQQERRVDLPTIGPDTIKALVAGQFAGVVLEAEHSLILHREKTIALADKHDLFVIGI
ncbi:MAG: UDP-2,3-diacylglucosamine diphosphatase LpxI [Rickettsiales bacterium]|nr:UDP-2,3-diacylglucosamine diphosphatase LpxI [Rickettsiales bacterium]